MFPKVDDFLMDFRLVNAKNQLELTDCLQIHLLELPKYVVPSDNRIIRDPVEQWAYFLLCAPYLTREQLLARLPDPVFAEAVGVLEMIARDPKQRQLYEDRLKFEMDERAKLQTAEARGLEKGLAEGEARGEARGRVRILQQIVGRPVSTVAELANKSLLELAEMEAKLQQQLRERGGA